MRIGNELASVIYESNGTTKFYGFKNPHTIVTARNKYEALGVFVAHVNNEYTEMPTELPFEPTFKEFIEKWNSGNYDGGATDGNHYFITIK